MSAWTDDASQRAVQEGGRTGGAREGTLLPRWRRLIVATSLALALGLAVVLVDNAHAGREIQRAVFGATRPLFLVVAVVSVLVALLADAASLLILVKKLAPRVHVLRAMSVSLESNFIGGATSLGGLEISYQLVFLRRLGLSLSQATSVVAVKAVVHTSLLLFFAAAILLPRAGLHLPALQRQIILAVAGTVALTWIGGQLWLKRPARSSASRFFPKFIRVHLAMLRESFTILVRAPRRTSFSLVGFQLAYWLALLAAVPLILSAYGSRARIAPVITGQATLQVFMPLSPLPGGGGVAEFGYLELIGPSVPGETRATSLIIWRALTWIVPILLGALAMGLRGARGKGRI